MREEGPKGDNESLRTVYAEASSNFRKLTEIRFQLLALLPLGTGLALSTDIASKNEGFALFGAAVTIALWVYDQRNNQHYDELVAQAASIERELGIFGGPFDARPRSWWKLRLAERGGSFWPDLSVEHRWPITLVYATALIVWLGQPMSSFVERGLRGSSLGRAAAWMLVTGAVWLVSLLIHESREAQAHRLRQAVTAAHRRLSALIPLPAPRATAASSAAESPDADLVALVKACGVSEPAARARLAYYLTDPEGAGMFSPRAEGTALGKHVAAQILGAIVDLPPRWIVDVEARRFQPASARLRKHLPAGMLVVAALLFVVAALSTARADALGSKAAPSSIASAAGINGSGAPTEGEESKHRDGATGSSSRSEPMSGDAVERPAVPGALSRWAILFGAACVLGGAALVMTGAPRYGALAVAAGALSIPIAATLDSVEGTLFKFDIEKLELGLRVTAVPSSSASTAPSARPSADSGGPPEPQAPAAGMTETVVERFSLLSIRGFPPGKPDYAPEQAAKTKLSHELLPTCGQYQRLILEGRADDQELTPETRANVVDNASLARRRAYSILELIRIEDKTRRCPTVIGVDHAGPDHIGNPSEELKALDRSVTIYGEVKLVPRLLQPGAREAR
jgi:hypothetical protein